MKKLNRILLGSFLALSAATALAAYPERTVRFIVPYPAGGATDATARIVAAKLQARWGQSVIVENKPGATGAIGTEQVARSAPDGYTLLVAVPILLSTELVRPAVNYRTLRDFAPITTIATSPIVLMAGASAPPGGLKAMLEAGRQSADGLNYGSHGAGTTTNYLGERLKKAMQVPIVHVPYAGENPAMTDLVGGHLKLSWLSGLSAKKTMAMGKVRPLAVASPVRTPFLPEVPTFKELGLEGFDRETWVRMFAPSGTPTDIVEQLSRDIAQVLKMPDVQEQFATLGGTARGGTPAETRHEIELDLVWWKGLIADFGVLGN